MELFSNQKQPVGLRLGQTKIAPTGPLDVTAQLQITRGGFRLNRTTQRYAQTLTVNNTSTQTIPGPVSIIFDQLSSNATLYAPAGVTAVVPPLGSP